MRYVLAVSGGVDSMVLLDMMSRVPGHELIVAHFDHGIRSESSEDAAFVASVAKRYGVTFETKREELGTTASEALARQKRYDFLKAVAKKHRAQLVTAHHLDDVVETIAINLKRGTGWRGLAVLDSGIIRPLVDTSKQSLLHYAQRNNIEWHEDATNQTDTYLRNRIRHQLDLSLDEKRQLRSLHAHQKDIKRQIESEIETLIGDGPTYNRHWFIQLETTPALECLRHATKGQLTRPQLARALHAVKVARPGTAYEAGEGVKLHFTTRQFSL